MEVDPDQTTEGDEEDYSIFYENDGNMDIDKVSDPEAENRKRHKNWNLQTNSKATRTTLNLPES